jgi:hypothetical protein
MWASKSTVGNWLRWIEELLNFFHPHPASSKFLEQLVLSLPHNRYGHYYLAIYGWCTPIGECGVPDDECPSSCKKVAQDKYDIIVDIKGESDSQN